MLQALAGYDRRDFVSTPVVGYTVKLKGEIKGIRLGVPTRFFPDSTDPEVQSAFEKAVQVMTDLGAQIEEVELPELDRGWPDIAEVLLNAEANVWHAPYLQTPAAAYGPQVRRFLERGKLTQATAYVKA